MEKYYHLNLRDWRKSVTGNVKYVRTLQFPLVAEQDIGDFKQFEDLYNILNGCKKGTINGLICALHLSGFKFFATGKETKETFIKQQSYDTDSFKGLYVLGFNTSFQPCSLVNFINKERRKKNNIINEQTIEKEKKSFKDLTAGKQSNDKIQTITDTWFNFIKDNYTEFKEFQRDTNEEEKVFNAFIKICQQNGIEISDNIYNDLSKKQEKVTIPENSTIIFDKNRLSKFKLKDIENSAYLAHITVAHLKNIDGSIDNLAPGTDFSSLSWLLGTGLKYWQNTEIKDICKDYFVPSQYEDIITELKTWFILLDNQKNIFTSTYADYRTAVGGALQAWCSNYLKRINTLEDKKDLKILIPEELYYQEQDIEQKYPYPLAEIEDNIKYLDVDKYKHAISCILGNKPSAIKESDFETVSYTIYDYNDIIGKIDADINILIQKSEKGIKNKNEKIEKLNRLTGGTPAPQDEIADIINKFNKVSTETYSFAEDILNKYQDTSKDILTVLIEEERKKANDSKNEIKKSPEEQAKRFVLQKVFSLVKSEPLLLDFVYEYCRKTNLIPKKYLNRLLINKTGCIYKSPFSRKNDDAYKVNEQEFAEFDIVDILNKLYDFSQTIQDKKSLRVSLAVKHLYYSLLLEGIKDRIDVDFSAYPFLQEIPMPKYVLNKNKSVDKKTVISILNYCKSYLNGFLFTLLRDNFIIRTNFSIVGNYKLFYAPKVNFKNEKTVWNIPHLYKQGKFAELLRNWPDTLDAKQLKDKIKQINPENKDNSSIHREFLIQAPHDLYVDLGLKEQTKKFGFVLGKGEFKNIWKENNGTYAKLIGPARYKNILDKTLLCENLKISEYTLLFERAYSQNIKIENNTVISAEIKPKGGVSCRIHIPVSDEENRQQILLNETVIGIDLGEAGIGYAVFPVTEIEKSIKENYTPQPIAYGAKAIGSIKKLIGSVKKYRKNIQRRQKFQKQYSDTQAKFRANVAGDIAHSIDAFCRKYKGFPVLERSVRNLSGGSKQLMSVYDKVLNMYCFSNVDAHKKERKSHWMQPNDAKSIQRHTVFKEDEKKDGKKTNNKIPLKLFMGQDVSAAATSQCCSKCGRNPLLSFEMKYGRDGKSKNIEIGSDSSVKVDNGILLLRKENYSKKQRNHSIPFNLPLEQSKLISASEGYKILKKQLRQRPDDLRSKDTTQSRYYCPYADCGKAQFTMHADANAAVNIVRKWAAKKLYAHIKPFWRDDKSVDKDE